jgi:uncharacterized membrane protein
VASEHVRARFDATCHNGPPRGSPRRVEQRVPPQHELSEDPNDFVARHLLGYTQGLSGSTVTFAALYLAAHGIVKIVLVAALLRNQMWAYPWMIGFLGLFILYQAYRLALAPTAALFALTVFDVFIVWLTWREWRKQTAAHTVDVEQ